MTTQRLGRREGKASQLDRSAQIGVLSALGSTVRVNRDHGITSGPAGHDLIRAARAASVACRGGMSHEQIAGAMGLGIAEVSSWLEPE
jgi:hypothetical protein